MLFVNLHVGTEFKLTVLGKVNLHARDNSVWAESVGDTIGMRETVEPEIARVNNFNNHSCWYFLEQ